MTTAADERVRGVAGRLERAERIADAIRHMLIRAAEEGRATGHIQVTLKDGHAVLLKSELMTGERDGFVLPDLCRGLTPAE